MEMTKGKKQQVDHKKSDMTNWKKQQNESRSEVIKGVPSQFQTAYQ